MLYTVITDYAGTTLVEQFRATNFPELVRAWLQKSIAKKKFANIETIAGEQAVLIEGCTNVWCVSLTDDNDVFFLLNIVATSEEKTGE